MEQLSGLDAAFVHQDSTRTPMHVTAVLLYDLGADGSCELARRELTELIRDRLGRFPVFRCRLHSVPLEMDAPYR